MKAQYAVAEYGKVVMKEKDLPKLGPGQLLLEAEYSFISPGTEYMLMVGEVLPLPQNVGYSMVLSLEWARTLPIIEPVIRSSPGFERYRAKSAEKP